MAGLALLHRRRICSVLPPPNQVPTSIANPGFDWGIKDGVGDKANTAYADFSRLASIMARDRFLPRQFINQTDRLAIDNNLRQWFFDAEGAEASTLPNRQKLCQGGAERDGRITDLLNTGSYRSFIWLFCLTNEVLSFD